MKNKNDFIDFLSLLYKVKLPSEKKVKSKIKHKGTLIRDDSSIHKGTLIRDDSSIQLPNFKKMDAIYEKYSNKLLADYLSYLV